MALEFIGGTLFNLLYDGVKQAMCKNAKLKFLLGDLKSTLDSLLPRDIQQIGDHNVELGLPNEEIESLKLQMEEGVKLVRNFSKFRMWNYYCCINDYTDQIVELDRSLKRLLEKLKLQEVRDVKELLILARTIKDKQDELERKMGDILKMQQETRDAMQSFVSGGSNTETVPRQIEGNGVGQVASVEGRAALGAVFGMLFDVVLGVKDKTMMFKPLLGDLKSTLDSLKPMIEEIVEHNKVLNRPKEELEHFRIQMEKGVELVHKCSKVRLWASYQQYKYTDKLLGLDESLQRLLNTLKMQVARDVRETLVSVRNIEAMIKQIEESGVVQNQIQTIGWCAAPESSSPAPESSSLIIESSSPAPESPYLVIESSSPVIESSSPTVVLDVPNVQGTWDVKEALVSVRNTKAGVNQIEGSGVVENQIEKKGTSGNRSRNTVSNTSSSSARRSQFSEAANPRMDKSQTTWKILEKSNLRVFSFAELKVTTRNFRRDAGLGEGGFGKVFKGWVDKKTLAPSKPYKGMAVAIKKLNPKSEQGFPEWQSEVVFLGKLSHPNLIKLLGYCCEKEELLLVYEFMPRGSLRNHLFRRSGVIESLSWNNRIKIAIGAARGLAFLHTSEEQVIHRDIKASNILLDGNYNAKISGFGLAKLGPADGESHVSTRVMGTFGYLAPEYVETGHLCVKSDVYSFGVMLLEILTGLRPTEQLNLVGWAKSLLCYERNLKTFMDVRMEGQYSLEAALQTADVTLNCLASDFKNRPSMEEVVEALEQIQAMEETYAK